MYYYVAISEAAYNRINSYSTKPVVRVKRLFSPVFYQCESLREAYKFAISTAYWMGYERCKKEPEPEVVCCNDELRNGSEIAEMSNGTPLGGVEYNPGKKKV